MQVKVINMENTGNKILEKIKDNPNKYAELCVEQYIKINPENSIKITKDSVLNIINDDEVIYNIVADSLPSIVMSDEEKAICNGIITYIMFNSLNLIKRTCSRLNLTYKQLGEKIGVSESTLLSIASTGKISKQIETAIELYKKTIELEEKLANSEKIKETLKEWLK